MIACGLVVGFDRVVFESRSAVIKTLEIIESPLFLSLDKTEPGSIVSLQAHPLSIYTAKHGRDAPSQYQLAQISFSLRIIHNTTTTNHFGQQNANVLAGADASNNTRSYTRRSVPSSFLTDRQIDRKIQKT